MIELSVICRAPLPPTRVGGGRIRVFTHGVLDAAGGGVRGPAAAADRAKALRVFGMRNRESHWLGRVACLGIGALLVVPVSGCAPPLLLFTMAGGAATMSGEPQRLSGTEGQDFDEKRVARIRSGVDTPEDVVGLLGDPQTKTYTGSDEEWVYRYYVPPSALRSGKEKTLTVHFHAGKVREVRYSIGSL
jgi:hypothetical protein